MTQRFIKRFMYHSLNHSALYAFLGLVFPLFISTIAFSSYPLEIDAGAGSWCRAALSPILDDARTHP